MADMDESVLIAIAAADNWEQNRQACRLLALPNDLLCHVFIALQGSDRQALLASSK